MSYAYELLVSYNPYFGIVYIRDSILQDGLFSMYLNCEQQDLPSEPMTSEQVRYVGEGVKGYEIYVICDTADMYSNYSFYSNILDSVKILRGIGDTFTETNIEVNTNIKPDLVVTAYPNPFTNAFRFSSTQPFISAKLFDPLGRIVKYWDSPESEMIFRGFSSEMPSGIYLMEFNIKGDYKHLPLVRIK